MRHTDKNVKIFEEVLLNPVQIGIVRTKHWVSWGGLQSLKLDSDKIGQICNVRQSKKTPISSYICQQGELWQKLTKKNILDQNLPDEESCEKVTVIANVEKKLADVFEISLGTDTRQIAHGLFAALREMDERRVQVIFIEGIDSDGDVAAAIMNRLRKAASLIV